MKLNRNLAISSIFILTDVGLLYAIFRLSVIVRNLLTPLFSGRRVLWQNLEPLSQLGMILAIVIFTIEGLYPGYGLTAVKELQRMSKSVTLVFLFLVSVSYLNKPFQDLSRAFLLFSWCLALGILPLGHFILRNIVSRFSWYGVPVVIFGDSVYAQRVAASLKQTPRLGWHPAMLLPTSAIKRGKQETLFSIAIFAPSPRLSVDKYALLLNQNFSKVILIRQTDRLGSVWVEPRDVNGQLGLEFHYNLFNRYARWGKRLMDLGLGFFILILLSPLWIILTLLIVIDSPGPVLFYQKRLSEGYKHFQVIKFRTMVVDAEKRLRELLKRDSAARAEYDRYHKLTNDPRITRFGKWLRRFSLDEFPQLLNVLKGDMSLVGPRAYMPSELDEMGDYTPTILRVKPGMTGWWQVMGRHGTTFQQRLRMDEYYISNWSLWMDLYILMKTVWVMLRGGGA